MQELQTQLRRLGFGAGSLGTLRAEWQKVNYGKAPAGGSRIAAAAEGAEDDEDDTEGPPEGFDVLPALAVGA